MPDNLVRHDLDWREVGTHKADSVARRIQLVNPKATCEVRKQRLGGQESSGSIERLIESLADCDLMIDANRGTLDFQLSLRSRGCRKKASVMGRDFRGRLRRPDRQAPPSV